jgi:predicted MFS family arabinose efflux permease
MRGGFMNINSAFQQLASGAAAMISGVIVVEGSRGTLDRFPWVGVLSCCCLAASLWLARSLPVPAPQTPPKAQ